MKRRPLLMIACSGAKNPGTHKAIDLYRGVMFDVLRKWMPEGDRAPEIFIISAKHGLVHQHQLLADYEQPMTPRRQQELLATGFDLDPFKGQQFTDVFIAGGAMYRAIGQAYVGYLMAAGILLPDAGVNATTGGIGLQRSQLGAYLRSLADMPDTVSRVRGAGGNKRGELHQVLTIKSKGGCRAKPCRTCPWRPENTGEFPAEAFRHSAPTAYDAALSLFSCHESGAKKPATCAGFLLRNSSHNLGVRLAQSMGTLDLKKVHDGGAELFPSYRAMAIANGVDPEDPVLQPCRDDN